MNRSELVALMASQIYAGWLSNSTFQGQDEARIASVKQAETLADLAGVKKESEGEAPKQEKRCGSGEHCGSQYCACNN